MTIDFEDLELPLARWASGDAEGPSPAVRDRIMAHVRADAPLAPSGFAFSLAASDKWLPHPVPGIRMRVLSVNRLNGYATLLLDVEPGTRFPPHHHAGAEECYVIAGAIYTCGRRLGPGDFVHADAGTDHGELWTDIGAQVLLVVRPDDDLPDSAG
jgi:anti-sigma factor ChrR (cupin superfamily)